MKNEDIKIIKLKPREWEKYKAIRLASLKMDPGAFNSTYEDNLKYPDKYWQDKLSHKNEIHLFASDRGKIIGTVNSALNEEGEEPGTAVIHGMYVDSHYRGKDIGKKLMMELIGEIIKNKNISKMKLWVKERQIPAGRVYESLGFLVTARAGEHTLIMEKII